MSILDFIKNYNTYKLTDEQVKKLNQIHKDYFVGISDRMELGFVNTEKCKIDGTIYDCYDEEIEDCVTCMLFEVYEIIEIEEDFSTLQDAYVFLEEKRKSKDFDTYAKTFKLVAVYSCKTNEECRDFLNTLINYTDFKIES